MTKMLLTENIVLNFYASVYWKYIFSMPPKPFLTDSAQQLYLIFMSHNGSCPTLLKTNILCNNLFFQCIRSHSLFFMWYFCIFFFILYIKLL